MKIKEILKKVFGIFKSSAKAKALELIKSLDGLEDDLAKEIDKRASAEKIAKVAIDWVQKQLTAVVEKIF